MINFILEIQKELLFIFLPFFGGLGAYLFRRQLGIEGVIIVNIISLFISGLIVTTCLHESFFSEDYNTKIIVLNIAWFQIFGLKIEWTFLLDNISLLMATLILTITFLVECYSMDYMEEDINQAKFFMFLSFFAFFMLIFVTAGNTLQMFIGWEGIGLISFFLINFWHTRLEANRSGLKAILFNKIGDIGFYGFLVLLFFFFNTLDIKTIQEMVEYYSDMQVHLFELLGIPKKIYFGQYEAWWLWILDFPKGITNLNLIHFMGFFDRDFKFCVLEFIGFCILLAAAGKSAQFGLHAWLASAMEGPTPVSSLLHSATMVTAGVFLIIRFNFIIVHCPRIMFILSFLGAITAFFSGVVALLQMDIKKIVAYSTCSQLGFMMAACGIGAFNIAFFHLYTHAFFKCLLFLTSGSVIHALHQEQDIRKMGGLSKILPFTKICMLIGYLGLIGLPFFSGFYSKEAILMAFLCDDINQISFILLLLTTFITCFYSVKSFMFIFYGKKKGSIYKLKLAHEAPIFMAIPLFFLAIDTIFIGFEYQELFIGIGSIYLNPSIVLIEKLQYFELLHFSEKFLPLFGLVFITSWCIIYYKFYFGRFFIYLYTFLIHRYLESDMHPFIWSILENKEEKWYWVVHLYFMLVVNKMRMITFFCFKAYKALALRWHWDMIYKSLSNIVYSISYNVVIKIIDRGYLESLGSFGLVQSLTTVSNWISKSQNGLLYSYIFLFFIGVVIYWEILIFLS